MLIKMGIGDWGLGIGDWGFGVWAKTPNPNPQSPFKIHFIYYFLKNKFNELK